MKLSIYAAAVLGMQGRHSEFQMKNFHVGSSSMKGWKIVPRDAQTYVLSLNDDPRAGYFGLYNGFGGEAVAQYITKHLHKAIVHSTDYRDNKFEQALKKGHLSMDQQLLEKQLGAGEPEVGADTLVVLIKNSRLYCANAGDSKAIASVNGKLVTLSPSNRNRMLISSLTQLKLKRILAHSFDPSPAVKSHAVNKDWEFIVLACPSVYNALPGEELLKFCRERIAKGLQPDNICQEVMIQCFGPKRNNIPRSGNFTVILVCLLQYQPYAVLSERCAVERKE